MCVTHGKVARRRVPIGASQLPQSTVISDMAMTALAHSEQKRGLLFAAVG